MPAVTDLTWAQINEAFSRQNPGVDVIPTTLINGKLYLDLSLFSESQVTDTTQDGVIKTLTKLWDLARAAQENANTGRAVGEKLVAFPPPTFGAATNGQAPITRQIAARVVLNSATQIVGTNA